MNTLLKEWSNILQHPWGYIWPLQRLLQRISSMCKMWQKGPRPHIWRLLKIIYLNCQQNYLTFSRSCDIYKREWDILEVKRKRNVTFFKARIVESYMEENTYALLHRVGDLIKQSNQVNKYRVLIEKLIQLEPKDCPKFQTEAQTNKEKSNEIIKGKTYTKPTKQRPHWSLTCLPTPKLNNLRKAYNLKFLTK